MVRVVTAAILMATFVAAAADRPKFVLIRSVTEVDEGADGSGVPFTVQEYSYDGHLVSGSRSEIDMNGDGVMDRRSISTPTHNRRGQLIKTVNESYDIATGAIEGRSVITYSYDRRGNRIGSRIEGDSDGDGMLSFIGQTTFSYEAGNLVGWVTRNDNGADGVWDQVQTTRRVYDSEGRLISAVREVASAADGEIGRRETWRYTIDSEGNTTSAEHEIDHYADGSIDYSDQTVYAYDRRGRLRTATTTYQTHLDEEVFQSASHSTYLYDRHGNQIKVIQESDAEADGVIDEIRTTTRRYARVRERD